MKAMVILPLGPPSPSRQPHCTLNIANWNCLPPDQPPGVRKKMNSLKQSRDKNLPVITFRALYTGNKTAHFSWVKAP